MKQSLTYYITLLIIKLKGLKKDFSKHPIDVSKIRRTDVHNPKGHFFKQNHIRRFSVSDSWVTEIDVDKNAKKLLVFMHGGAFISGPAKHHWDSAKEIAEQTKVKIWMCDYPKSPENNIVKISQNIDAIYTTALAHYRPDHIYFMGDSAGGTLIVCLVQRLIKQHLALPKKIILVCPVMDASMSNPEIDGIDSIDPMLSKVGVLSAKKMCAGHMDLKDTLISPLYGSFEKFSQTLLFVAENDITYPDQKRAIEKFNQANVPIKVVLGKNMPHIWPLLPVMKEAKTALNTIIEVMNN